MEQFLVAGSGSAAFLRRRWLGSESSKQNDERGETPESVAIELLNWADLREHITLLSIHNTEIQERY